MSESSITADIVERLRKQHGCFVVKIAGGPYQMIGLPDVLCLKDGVHLWIEFKSTEGKLKGSQIGVHKQLEKNGAHAFVVRFQEPKLWIVDDFYNIRFRLMGDAVASLLNLLLELGRSAKIKCNVP